MASLDSRALQKVCAEVYRKYPAVNGCNPKVQPYNRDQFLVIFQSRGKTANGLPLSTTVRAVANQDGKIIKLSASK